MDMRKEIEKDEKQEDVIVLDKGIDTSDVIEPQNWLCCAVSIWPYRAV